MLVIISAVVLIGLPQWRRVPAQPVEKVVEKVVPTVVPTESRVN